MKIKVISESTDGRRRQSVLHGEGQGGKSSRTIHEVYDFGKWVHAPERKQEGRKAS